ncbi:MAG: shikimate dehydrogenase, partial [Bacteroidales bacterium]|nr:shikimate dehydrogenase [Bacteroidales bacterium]
MKLYGLIGYPLSHSQSREYFLKKFNKQNISNCDYKLFEIENLKTFPELIKNTPELVGLNITIPHKKTILNYLDEIDPTAKKIGAVNCIKIEKSGEKIHLKGFNTDVLGFESSLNPLLKSWHNKALILGTGGSSKAVAHVLEKLEIEHIFISRNPVIPEQINYHQLNKDIIEEHTLIINTTPIGMFPEMDISPDIPYQYLCKNHLLFDLIYNPKVTLFLKKGKERGAMVINGLEMLY